MDQVYDILNMALDIFRSGFYRVNGVQGLLIAIVVAYAMPNWQRLLVMALGAVIIHAVLDVMIPVLSGRGAFRLPPLVELEYWKYLLSLYAGYLITVSVFFVVKTLVLKRAH